jgi:hypothetical protein
MSRHPFGFSDIYADLERAAIDAISHGLAHEQSDAIGAPLGDYFAPEPRPDCQRCTATDERLHPGRESGMVG